MVTLTTTVGTGTIPESQFPSQKTAPVTLGWRSCCVSKYSTHIESLPLLWFLAGSVIKVIKHHNFYITTCFSFAVHIMGDVKLVTSTRVSKTSLTLSPPVPIEAPAFTLPPRNIRVQLGATARFEGKVRNRQWRASPLGFALSWSWPGGCKGSEVASATQDLYSRRIHQCLPSWEGRSITGLFLCRGVLQNLSIAKYNLVEHARNWGYYQWETAARAVSSQHVPLLQFYIFSYCTFITLHPKYLPVHEAACVTQI